jgi:hypothetical protein
MSNHWELFSSMKGWKAVSAALDKALEEAKLLAPEKPSRERALIARDYVRKVMVKYRDFGAEDTEPDTHLVQFLNEHFNTDISRWDESYT